MNQNIPVLLYHSVTDTPARGLERFTVTPDRFAAHLDRLIDDDRAVMTLGGLAAHLRSGEPVPAGAAVVTFDDGFEDFARNAWPLLRERGLPATLYVVAGCVGDRSRWLPGTAGNTRMLTAADLSTLAADGVEIGAHSMTHPHLDLMAPARARQEITDSKDVLEQILSRPVTTFAYPHGHHSGTVKQLVVDAGYTSAAAVRNKVSHERDDVYAIARLTITDTTTADGLDRLLQGRGVRRASRREAWRTKAGRQLRRIRRKSGSVA